MKNLPYKYNVLKMRFTPHSLFPRMVWMGEIFWSNWASNISQYSVLDKASGSSNDLQALKHQYTPETDVLLYYFVDPKIAHFTLENEFITETCRVSSFSSISILRTKCNVCINIFNHPLLAPTPCPAHSSYNSSSQTCPLMNCAIPERPTAITFWIHTLTKAINTFRRINIIQDRTTPPLQKRITFFGTSLLLNFHAQGSPLLTTKTVERTWNFVDWQIWHEGKLEGLN